MPVTQRKQSLASEKARKTAKKAAPAKKISTVKPPTATKKPTPKKYVRHNPKPKFKATNEQRTLVAMSVASGFTHRQICERVINPATGEGISLETLRRNFRHELDNGEQMMIAGVRRTLAAIALDPKNKSAVAAGIWILKTRAGDREPMPAFMAAKLEAEARASQMDKDGNETVLKVTLKLEEDRAPPEEDEFDYSTASKIK